MKISVSETFHCTAKALYLAWLDSEKHSRMTGAKAVCQSEIDASFSAWEGYISGRNVALEPYSKIIQKWRTTNFLDNDLDSEITISFEEINGSTKITIEHDSIPDGQPDYSQGWRDHYFTPMKTIWPDK